MSRRIPNPRFLLCYPPLQFASSELIRPDGTLALPYLDAALTAAGFESDILDMSVGTPGDSLGETFYRQEQISDDFVRVGMTHERILQEAANADVIGITSIFTQQTSRCFEIGRLIKEAHPEKILIAGGVNARSLREHFFDHGFDIVFLSEGEKPIVEFAHHLRDGNPDLSEIAGLAYRVDGKTVTTGVPRLTVNLDDYAMPSWHKLPNQKYWDISRVWGGTTGWMEGVESPRYAAIFTSRGCPFRCLYCHISKERGGEAGDIGGLRLHSNERVDQELSRLKELGVQYLYINDDSFLAKRKRVRQILARLQDYDFKLADVNGVNIIHLFRRQGDRLVVDEELLQALFDAGFRKLSMPFESGNERLIKKYSTGKWSLESCDVVDLVRKLSKVGLVADGNFMIGYPDETPEELAQTFLLARRLMDEGLVGCQFFMVQPFPGTRLFDDSIASGQLKADWHWDELGWSKGSPFTNPLIDREVLKFSWSLVYRLLNRETRVQEFGRQLEREIEGP